MKNFPSLFKSQSSSPDHTHTYRNYKVKKSESRLTAHIYNADIILSIDHTGSLDILKNRYGMAEQNLSIENAINFITIMLTTAIFKGRNLGMFQEGLRIKLKKVIKKAIEEERGDIFENSI